MRDDATSIVDRAAVLMVALAVALTVAAPICAVAQALPSPPLASCLLRSARTLFQETTRLRQVDPGVVFRRIRDGSFASQIMAKCGVEDKQTAQAVIEWGPFKDWISAQNDRYAEETKKQDQWFDPEQNRVIGEYIDCLYGSARALAILSDEPAETVVKATLPACDAKADQLRQTYHKFADAAARRDARVGLDGDKTRREYADMAENLLEHLNSEGHNKLILTVIEERARQRNQRKNEPLNPQGDSKTHDTPL